MTSVPTTLRELVGHLARAQRAFDAGRNEEAERALGDALALDPENVQAADLRQRLAKRCQPAHRHSYDTAEPPRPGQRTGRSRRASRAPASRDSPAAWLTFEQRVRERRAERAVSEAQEALARDDEEAAAAALAELDAVAPHDARRDGISAALARFGHDHATVAAATAVAAAARPVARVRVPVTPPLADLATLPLDRGLPRTAERRHPAPAARVRSRSWVRAAVGCAGIAASAALGFWIITPEPGDSLWTTAARQPPSTASSQPPVDAESDLNTAPQATAPLSDSVDAGSALPEVNQAPLAEEPADASPGVLGRPAESVSPPPSEVRAEPAAPAATTPPRATLDGRLTESASLTSARPPDRSPETARAAPAAVPLDAPVQSPTVSPDTPRTVDSRGGVTPVPEPPAAPVPAAATASGAETETRAVRGVLDGYADAFSTLDANATQRVWPAVDLRGLRRAFDQLTAQTITFNRCDVNAAGETAEAVCVGRATWVPKVGDRSPKSEPRTWRFALGRDAGEWIIDRVEVQR